MIDIDEYEEEDYESDLKKELAAKRVLKPCPFCGNNVKLKHYKTDKCDWWYVACQTCGIAVDPWMWNAHQTKNETIDKWNRRVNE